MWRFSGHLSIYQLFWKQACPEGLCTNGTQVQCEALSLPNSTTRKGWPLCRGLQPLLFLNSDVGSFTSHKNKSVKVLWDGIYGFLSLSEKTRMSNHFQMYITKVALSSQLFKDHECWSGRGFEPMTSRSADRRSPNWATGGGCLQESNHRSSLLRGGYGTYFLADNQLHAISKLHVRVVPSCHWNLFEYSEWCSTCTVNKGTTHCVKCLEVKG